MTVEKPLLDHRPSSVTLQPAHEANNTSESKSESKNEYTSGQLRFFDMQSYTHMFYRVQMSEKLCPTPKGSPPQKKPVGYSTFWCFLASSSC